MESENHDLKLVEVGVKNFTKLIDLAPFKSQYKFVADDICSLAEAYANIADGRYAKTLRDLSRDEPVGFLMIGYNISDEGIDREKFPLLIDNYLIRRFMIDKKHQKKGYGREAMKLALEYIRTFPSGTADYCRLSYEPENETARKLYRSFWFEKMQMPEDRDKVPAVLKL